MHDDEVVNLVGKLKSLERERYKTLILCGPPLSGKTKLAKSVCESYGANYIDITADFLPMVKFPSLGVYGANEFYSWIKKEISSFLLPLCIDEVESLFATFPANHVESLFEMLQRLEVSYPLLFVTRLENILRKTIFPLDRVYFVKR